MTNSRNLKASEVLRSAGRRRLRMAGAIAGLFLLAAPSRAAEPIEIGMSVALTGYLASFDGQLVDGVKLAVKQVNESGGADGHELRLHILDNASNAATGVTVTNQLVNQYNAAIMINGASSAQSVAILPILVNGSADAVR